ncbi:MAG TPA: HD domain-containing protein [Tepidisphaeraceae bacterium]|jgi:(p)ppGpp synthase/HD superfamily hydrolase|nr:HD domain-containing protein [Tepidisphaeraceae bacterium]
MADLLSKAIALAAAAHAGQEHSQGEAYVLHPLRVMAAVALSGNAQVDERLRCVAVLHDVLERTATTADDLRRAGMPLAVVRAVQRLTHDEGTAYADYIVKLKRDPLARAVKIADLMDNADLRRVTFRPGKLKQDLPRLARYAASHQFLTGRIDEKAYRGIMERTQR